MSWIERLEARREGGRRGEKEEEEEKTASGVKQWENGADGCQHLYHIFTFLVVVVLSIYFIYMSESIVNVKYNQLHCTREESCKNSWKNKRPMLTNSDNK